MVQKVWLAPPWYSYSNSINLVCNNKKKRLLATTTQVIRTLNTESVHGLNVFTSSDSSLLDFKNEAFICKNLFCQHLGERCNCKLHLFLENYQQKALVKEIRLRNKGLTVFPNALLSFVNLEVLDLGKFEDKVGKK